jgi:4-amino-4-deoxy-L-arabinose transferase-like glycosyltransferase
MNDRVFEVSLTSLAGLVLALIMAGIGLAVAGMRWVNVDMPLLVFLTILVGLTVLISGGGLLLFFWGKSYMSRG